MAEKEGLDFHDGDNDDDVDDDVDDDGSVN